MSPNIRSEASPSATTPAVKVSRIPRIRLAPLFIVKTPTLSTITACTLSPTSSPSPTQASFRPRPLLRSFSAPSLFTGGRDGGPFPPSLQVPECAKPPHYLKRTTCIPQATGHSLGNLSPKVCGIYYVRQVADAMSLQINVKFEFEPTVGGPVGKPTLKSRFSSGSTIIPAKRRWYNPRLNLRGKDPGLDLAKSIVVCISVSSLTMSLFFR